MVWCRVLLLLLPLLRSDGLVCPEVAGRSPSNGGDRFAFVDVLTDDGEPVGAELFLRSNQTTTLYLVPSIEASADLFVNISIPLGFSILELDSIDSDSARLTIPANSVEGLRMTFFATGYIAPSPLCFSAIHSMDPAFDGVSVDPASMTLASVVPASVEIGILDENGDIVNPGEQHVFTSSTMSAGWEGDWPHAVELYGKFTRNGKSSVAGGRIPIVVPDGWEVEGYERPYFWTIEKMPDTTLSNQAVSTDSLRIRPTYTTYPGPPAVISFGQVESQDPQWEGVQPAVDDFVVGMNVVCLGLTVLSLHHLVRVYFASSPLPPHSAPQTARHRVMSTRTNTLECTTSACDRALAQLLLPCCFAGSYDRGTISVTPSFLSIEAGSTVELFFAPSAIPTHPINITFTLPPTFSTAQGDTSSYLILPAGTIRPVTVTVVAGPSPFRDLTKAISFGRARSDDIQFAHLQLDALLVYCYARGEIGLENLPEDFRQGVHLEVNTSLALTLTVLQKAPFSLDSGRIPFIVPEGPFFTPVTAMRALDAGCLQFFHQLLSHFHPHPL